MDYDFTNSVESAPSITSITEIGPREDDNSQYFSSEQQLIEWLTDEKMHTHNFSLSSPRNSSNTSLDISDHTFQDEIPCIPASGVSILGPPTVLIPYKPPTKVIFSIDPDNHQMSYRRVPTTTSTHPLGIRDYIPATSAVLSSKNRDQFWDRTLGDAKVYILNSVVPSTMDQYKVGVKHFLEFMHIFGTNVTMTVKPVQWYRNPHLHCYTFIETVVMSFLAYLRSDPKVEPLTAINYLSACRKYWINCNVDVREIDNSVVIKDERAGMVKLWRAVEGNKAADRLTLPFGVDMIEYMFQKTFPNYLTGPLIEHAVCVATMTGYSCIARQCEYLYTPASKNPHHLRVKDGVQWTVLHEGEEVLINGLQVGPYTEDDLRKAYVDIRDAKNDIEGAGNRMPFDILDLEFGDSGAAFCLGKELFRYAKRAKFTDGNAPFFSSPRKQENWALTADILNYYMRKVASEGFGITTKKISSKSLRIGAASALANGNVPDYVIQKVGRWKSLVFLQYIRLARGAFQNAQRTLLDRNNFNINDVRHWHPGARHLLANLVPEDYPDDGSDVTDNTSMASSNEYWPPL